MTVAGSRRPGARNRCQGENRGPGLRDVECVNLIDAPHATAKEHKSPLGVRTSPVSVPTRAGRGDLGPGPEPVARACRSIRFRGMTTLFRSVNLGARSEKRSWEQGEGEKAASPVKQEQRTDLAAHVVAAKTGEALANP
jgi:hypothetical protein